MSVLLSFLNEQSSINIPMMSCQFSSTLSCFPDANAGVYVTCEIMEWVELLLLLLLSMELLVHFSLGTSLLHVIVVWFPYWINSCIAFELVAYLLWCQKNFISGHYLLLSIYAHFVHGMPLLHRLVSPPPSPPEANTVYIWMFTRVSSILMHAMFFSHSHHSHSIFPNNSHQFAWAAIGTGNLKVETSRFHSVICTYAHMYKSHLKNQYIWEFG